MVTMQTDSAALLTGIGTTARTQPDRGADRLSAVAAADAVDDVLNLSGAAGRDVIGTFHRLDSGEQQDFLTMLAELLSQGVVGTETLEVNHEPYVSFLPSSIADPRLAHARPWRQDQARHALDILA